MLDICYLMTDDFCVDIPDVITVYFVTTIFALRVERSFDCISLCACTTPEQYEYGEVLKSKEIIVDLKCSVR